MKIVRVIGVCFVLIAREVQQRKLTKRSSDIDQLMSEYTEMTLEELPKGL